MTERIYVGNLPYSMDDDGLRATFGKFGAIEEAHVIIDRATGRSKGFGFITFQQPAAARSAIEEMNQTDCQGRFLRVSQAKGEFRNGANPRQGGRRR
jgi:RNA recognition motif-containing protein